MANEITYNITRHVGVLSVNNNSGWQTEANIISWNGGREKLDIRSWSPDHSKRSKGITLREDEARALAIALNNFFGGQV